MPYKDNETRKIHDRVYNKEYYKKNREKIIESNSKSAKKHREKINTNRKIQYHLNKEKFHKKRERLEVRFSQAKSSAKRRKEE